MGVKYDLSTEAGIASLLEDVAKGKVKAVEPIGKGEDTRTDLQNRSLWLWANKYSAALNDAGFDIVHTLKPGIDIPWTKTAFVERTWRPVQEVMFQTTSTKKMSTAQCCKISEVIIRTIAGRTGVSVPWPNKEELIHAARVSDMMGGQR